MQVAAAAGDVDGNAARHRHFALAVQHRLRNGTWEAVDAGKEELPARGDEPMRLELAAFLEACRGRGPNPVPAEVGVLALEVVEAAARSARLGRMVTIAETR